LKKKSESFANIKKVNILGISAFYHDSAACLVQDGKIIAAAQEERFTRRKHDPNFPRNAIAYCLKEGGINYDQIDYVAFYDKPLLKFERILKTFMAFAPKGFESFIKAMPIWFDSKLFVKNIIEKELNYTGKILFPEHHESHAMSAFFASPFQDSAVLTLDGVGEWATSTVAIGRGNKLEIISDIRFPHSLGLLYSAFTYYTGFKVNSGEYKVMGLAPYGRPIFKDMIYQHLIHVQEDGSFHLNMEYFDFPIKSVMTSKRFHELFGAPPRKPESALTQREMDLARSIQDVTEEIVIKIAKHIRKKTGLSNLCLAGGVALNCVANGRLLNEGIFENIWIQPAAGDAGGALGAALGVWYQFLDNSRVADGINDSMNGSYLGPEFSEEEIRSFLNSENIPYTFYKSEILYQKVADLLNNEKIIGWFQGRMEFGPRSLGARSIIGDARSIKMQEKMNLKIKFRESFRPFAPSVLLDKVEEWFDLKVPSPYMLLVAPVKKKHQLAMTEDQKKLFGIDKLNVIRSNIPAVTHIDYSARIQTVNKETLPEYHKLLSTFNALHGCPVIVNTSFNVRGEPPVCSPKDAYRCFMRTDMDFLILGNFIIDKSTQNPISNDTDWQKEFDLD
jgi:carbamoyltransferase